MPSVTFCELLRWGPQEPAEASEIEWRRLLQQAEFPGFFRVNLVQDALPDGGVVEF